MTRSVAAGGRATLAWALVALVAAACATPSPRGPTYPPQGVSPPPAGAGSQAALNAVLQALAAAGLEAAVSTRPYRPPEAARLAAAARTVVQVNLPTDPERGLLAVYELGSSTAARAAAEEQAAYIATGPGRIQFPPDARFAIRVVGSSVVFFTWSPGSAMDPRTGDIATALASVGAEVPVGA